MVLQWPAVRRATFFGGHGCTRISFLGPGELVRPSPPRKLRAILARMLRVSERGVCIWGLAPFAIWSRARLGAPIDGLMQDHAESWEHAGWPSL